MEFEYAPKIFIQNLIKKMLKIFHKPFQKAGSNKNRKKKSYIIIIPLPI